MRNEFIVTPSFEHPGNFSTNLPLARPNLRNDLERDLQAICDGSKNADKVKNVFTMVQNWQDRSNANIQIPQMYGTYYRLFLNSVQM